MATSTPDICPECGEKLIQAGPLWLGKIQNKEFIGKMIEESESKHLNSKKELLKLLNACLIEADSSATFYDVHAICRTLKISAPKFDLIFDELRNNGFEAEKTHFSPIGIKTNAPISEVKNALILLNND